MIVRLAARSGKLAFDAAMPIIEPSPWVVNTFPLYDRYSATILAFHAPPAAVTHPVTSAGKTLGRYSFFQSSTLGIFMSSDAYLSSTGTLIAPARTLNKMYHCTPRSIKNIAPAPNGILNASIAASANG